MNERKKNFLELGRGAMLERFDYELDRVVDNILDPNTPANKPRKITMEITLLPDADRQYISYSVVVKPKPQPTNPIAGATAVMPNGDGGVQLVEMTPQIPGQYGIYGEEQQAPDVIQIRRQA